MNNHNNLFWDNINAMHAETSKNLAEASKNIAEATRLARENEQKIKEMAADNDKRAAENDKRAAENDRRAAESKQKFDEMIAEDKIRRRERDRQLDKLGRFLGGIANSNGEMAESYFYNAFRADKTFANEKFDKVKRNQAYRKNDIEAEFDLILFNGKSAALIEVKYNAKPENISIEKIISRVEVFKILYPEYKNHRIYLGVAAMSFKKGLETELHQAGIATIKQIGKKMVVFDKDVKIF